MNCMPRYAFHTAADTVFLEAMRVQDNRVLRVQEHRQRMQESLTAAGLSAGPARQLAGHYLQQAMDSAGVQPDTATAGQTESSAPAPEAYGWAEPFHAHRVEKLRFQYSRQGIDSVSLQPYTVRRVTRLRLRELPDETPLAQLYPGKFQDRGLIDRLREGLEATEEAVFLYNAYITDAGRASLAFRRDDRWYTPSTPLLPGTTRCRLIREGVLQVADIRRNDLAAYTEVSLFSAMLPLGALRLAIDALQLPRVD